MKHALARIFALAMVAAATAFSASCAQAQGAAGMQKLEARFAAADADHDGKLTLAEAQAGMPQLAKHFDEIDDQHTGFVTLPQIEKFVAAHKK